MGPPEGYSRVSRVKVRVGQVWGLLRVRIGFFRVGVGIRISQVYASRVSVD